MKLPRKSGKITDKSAMWSTEINYGDGNGDGHGEGWSKIVKDGKRQWELVSPHFHRTFTVFRRSTFVRQMLQNFGYVDEHSYRKKKKADHRISSVNIPNILLLLRTFSF